MVWNFGHVERSTGWISEVRKLNVVAQKRSGRPRKSWDEVIKNDRKKLDMGNFKKMKQKCDIGGQISNQIDHNKFSIF